MSLVQSHPSPEVSPQFKRRTRSVLTLALSFGAVVFLVWYAADLFLLAFLSVLLAIFLRSLSDRVAGWTGMNDRIALLSVVVVLASLAVASAWVLSSELISQVSLLVDQLPDALANLKARLGRYQAGQVLVEQWGRAEIQLRQTSPISQATNILSATAGALSAFALVLVTGVFLAINPRMYLRGVISLFPRERRPRIREIAQTLGHALRWWLLGKVVSMLIIGTLTTIGLKLLGMELALVLGVIAGLLNFIPYMGPLLSGIPAILIAFMGQPHLVLWVMGMYTFIQFVENNLLTPLIERRTVQLPPALTIFMQVLFGLMFGFLGLLLASPMTAVGMILVKMLYIEDQLGEQIEPI